MRHALVTETIRQVHRASRGTYGYRRVHAELTLGRGIVVGHGTVELPMARAGLEGVTGAPKWRRPRPDLLATDLVDRRFTREGVDQLWVTDITEHPTREGKVYCAVVLDVCSRRVGGWLIDSSPTAALPTFALGMAIDTRRPAAGTIIHSDHGAQTGLNRSSQHLDREVCAWDGREIGLRWRRGGLRCGRRVVRRWRVVSIGSGSGRRLLGAPRVRMPGSGLACRRRSERGGFVRLAECRPQTSRYTVAVTCRSRSA